MVNNPRDAEPDEAELAETELAEAELAETGLAETGSSTNGDRRVNLTSMWLRAVCIVLAALCLLAGLAAALLLLDIPPLAAGRLPASHGMLMTLGFIGTVICLERAVALGALWGFAGAALLGGGGLLLLAPGASSRWCFLAGTLVMVMIYLRLWQRQRDIAVLIQASGAVFAAGAALMWAGHATMPVVTPWLMGFVVLTITGERLELARVAMVDPVPLLILSVLFSCGLAATILWPAVGYPAAGLALLLITGWLWYHDVARRTIRGTGLTRYMAAAMLAGYFWLIIAAAVWMLDADPTHGAAYDAALHAVFLGFTMSMIFAHAPVILPAIARRPLPYHRLFWLPLLLLHGSVAVRLWLGDAYGSEVLRQAGGAVNVVAVMLFALLVLTRLARRP